MRIHPVAVELSYVEGQTDGRTYRPNEANSHLSPFYERP